MCAYCVHNRYDFYVGTTRHSTITWRNKKDKKMIKNIRCFKKGTLGQLDLHDLKEYIDSRVFEAVVNFIPEAKTDDWDCGQFIKHEIFDRFHLGINTKNIEYGERYEIDANSFIDDKFAKALARLNIAGIDICLTIYRIGAYSYFAAECTPFLHVPDPKACTC